MKNLMRGTASALAMLVALSGPVNAQIVSSVNNASTPITTPGYYISAAGSDSNDGLTTSTPILTFTHAQTLLQGGAIKTLYVMSAGGSFASPNVALTASDNGETFIANPGDFPILDAGGSVASLITITSATGITIQGLTLQHNSASSGANTRGALVLNGGTGNLVIANHFTNVGGGILITASANNTVSGNQFDNAGQGNTTGGTTCGSGGTSNCGGSAIEIDNTSNGNTIDSNLINGGAGFGTNAAGIYMHGVNNNNIKHNVIENTSTSAGIGLLDFSVSTENNNNTISFNIVHNSNSGATATSDSGGIYILARNLWANHTVIDHNFVDFPSSITASNIRAIYLDDCASNVTVTNNIVWNAPASATQVHLGSNNNIQNNVFHTSTSASAVHFSQSTSASCAGSPPAMGGNTYTSNLDISADTTPAYLSSISGQGTTLNEFLYAAGNTWSGLTASGFSISGLQNNVNPLLNAPGGVTITSNVLTLGDFSLQGGSTAPGLGFNVISQTNMGLHPLTAHWAYVY